MFAPRSGLVWLALFALGVSLGGVSVVGAQPTRPDGPRPAPARPPAPPGHHATPKGWKFSLPKGDAAKGREVFAKLECYSCHEVKGEKFPGVSETGKAGPELAAMAPHHPPEFFAESIVNPGAFIEKGKGYAAADRSSKMPSFNDSLTVQELVDLVAYLKALKLPAGHHH